MADEPVVKRAVAFFDGQNLYRHAKDAFGHHHPNYDPKKLFDAICADKGWANRGVRFYTGTPARERSEMWHGYLGQPAPRHAPRGNTRRKQAGPLPTA